MSSKFNISEAFSNRRENRTPVKNYYDDMFGLNNDTQINNELFEIDISLLEPHPLDPFRYYSEDKLIKLAESISTIGLLNEIIIRPTSNSKYQILAGKNRTKATLLNNKDKILAKVRNVDDDTAIMIMTDSNLKNRDELLPTERGWAYRLQLEVLNKQGKRTDLVENLTSVHGAPKLSRQEIAELNDVDETTITRYVRMTYLVSELAKLVDNSKIHFMCGYELSFVDEKTQINFLQYINSDISIKKYDKAVGRTVRSEYERNQSSLTVEQINKLFTIESKPKAFSINRNKFKDIASHLPSDKELEKLFIEFLKERFSERNT